MYNKSGVINSSTFYDYLYRFRTYIISRVKNDRGELNALLEE
jgi:hypothetical protein